MKRTHLMSLVAFLSIGTAIALSPLQAEQPRTAPAKPQTITAQIHAEKVEPTPMSAPTATPTPALTWQDNPQGCDESRQWIAAEPPYNCIEKPQPTQVTTQPIQTASRPAVAPQVQSYGGTKEDWMRAAGIPQDVWFYADFIVSHESGWNPNAVNPSSGACGLGQQLPCGKWAGAWNDPVAALRAMNGYVSRYGGWAGAYAFWQANRWY